MLLILDPCPVLPFRPPSSPIVYPPLRFLSVIIVLLCALVPLLLFSPFYPRSFSLFLSLARGTARYANIATTFPRIYACNEESSRRDDRSPVQRELDKRFKDPRTVLPNRVGY